METQEHVASQLAQLRDELKAWEKRFADAHDGRKAAREDIKADHDIAAKYKEYLKLKEPQTKPKVSKAAPRTPRKKTPRLQQQDSHPVPNQQTEVKADIHEQEHISATPQSVRCTFIGPTPQKNGVPLGLFDNMPSGTPRKAQRVVLGEMSLNVTQTPSRRQVINEDDLLETGRRVGRTPQSSGKRFMLDAFATPLKRKLDEDGTPSSSKRVATPAFLKRSFQLDMVSEETELLPIQPLKRKSFGRSLSTMIQEKRRQDEEEQRRKEEEQKRREEEAIDEEMEMLREFETGGMSAETAKKPATGGDKALVFANVETSQLPSPEPITDDFFGSDLDQESRPATDLNAQPTAYKKRGLKRQTRRVIMRPSRPSVKPQSEANGAGDSSTDQSDDNQDEDFDDEEANVVAKAACNQSVAPEKRKQEKGSGGKAAGTTSKASRSGTINPNAVSHANFRSLKIKNKNSKAKGRRRR